jgi:hypothetical protein
MQVNFWHAISDHRADRVRAVLEFMGLQVEAFSISGAVLKR